MKKLIVGLAAMAIAASGAWALDDALVAEANAALAKCTTYLVNEVAYNGGYAGSYLEDLSDQWGEGHILRHMNWVQPPGSPSTGQAFMAAWRATGDDLYLDAAVQCAHALAWGQLESGGWTYNTDFSPAGEQRYFYRHNRDSDDPKLKAGRNVSTFDDNTSQAPIRLLMAVDEALEGTDVEVHEAAMAGLDWVLEAQYDHGGFPQRYPLSDYGYGNCSTFNDGNIYHIMYLLMAAWEQYEDERYQDALLKLGDFLVNSQLPEPQPIWAQQYDSEMRPAWARRFEPASVTGGESNGVMRALTEMAVFTGDTKFLEPLPAALAWYQRSQLENGKWARFYELKTNRPLYFTSDGRTTYRVTYDDSDNPDHYSFNSSSYPTKVEEILNAINEMGIEKYQEARAGRELTTEENIAKAERMEADVREILDAQTDKGVWVSKELITMRTVQRSMRALAQYLGYANDR